MKEFKITDAPDAVAEALQSGRHFGKGGSLDLAKQHRGNHPLLANVHYTVASYLYTRGGFLRKLRAVWHLYLAKRYADKGMLYYVERWRDLSMENGVESTRFSITPNVVGKIHVLMSCHAQWARVLQKLRLNINKERALVLDCHKIIQLGGEEPIQVLSYVTLLQSPFERSKREEIRWRVNINNFIARNEHTESRGIAQVVARAMRALGSYKASADLARRFGLGDQVAKGEG